MAQWNYSKPPFKAITQYNGRGHAFDRDEFFQGMVSYDRQIECGNCGTIIPIAPTGTEPQKSGAVRFRVWVSALHVICHSCAMNLSQDQALHGKICGQGLAVKVLLATGPGQERCTQCTLRRNAEPGCWCAECAGYAKAGNNLQGIR